MSIYIVGDITEEAFKEFDELLSEAEKRKDRVIDIVLSSGGGSAYDALSFHDRIKNSPKEIRITAYGTVFSAAVLILASGDIRRMTKNSWAMVHEDITDVTSDLRVTAAKKSLDHSQQLEDQWNRLLVESCGQTTEYWAMLHRAETYLTAVECFGVGLIDEVLR